MDRESSPADPARPGSSSFFPQRARALALGLLAGCASPPDVEGEPQGSPAPAKAEASAGGGGALVAATLFAEPARERSPASGPCPEGMRLLGAFCIDRYEAHLVVRAPGGATRRHPHHARPEPGVRYEARSEAGVFPQAYISRVEAARACASAQKRLCSLREWRAACRGARLAIYPYGKDHEAGRCNSGKPHLLDRFFGPEPARWRYDAHFNDPRLAKEPGFLAPAGAHAGCASEEGIFDMVGNLHEWVSDDVTRALLDRLRSEHLTRHRQPAAGGNGVFVGGFFSTRGEHGPGCLYTTVAHDPSYHDYSTGFRCCAAPSPIPPKG